MGEGKVNPYGDEYLRFKRYANKKGNKPNRRIFRFEAILFISNTAKCENESIWSIIPKSLFSRISLKKHLNTSIYFSFDFLSFHRLITSDPEK